MCDVIEWGSWSTLVAVLRMVKTFRAVSAEISLRWYFYWSSVLENFSSLAVDILEVLNYCCCIKMYSTPLITFLLTAVRWTRLQGIQARLPVCKKPIHEETSQSWSGMTSLITIYYKHVRIKTNGYNAFSRLIGKTIQRMNFRVGKLLWVFVSTPWLIFLMK